MTVVSTALITQQARRSASELRRFGRTPRRYSMHPDDAEAIIGEYLHRLDREGRELPDDPVLTRFLGLPVKLDDERLRGYPVAEFV